MYFVNCWLRNRYRLVVYVTAGCALTLLGTLPVTTQYLGGRWVVVHPATMQAVQRAWTDGVDHTGLALAALLLFAAADFGCLGLSEISGRREYDFLVTRPRPRQHFVLVTWLAGLSELCVLTVIPTVVALVTLTFLTSRFYPSWLLPMIAIFLALAALIYSSTFAWTMATGSTRSGFELAFALVIIGMTARSGFQPYWIYYRFFRLDDIGHLYDWFINQDPVHPSLSLLLLLAATAAMPFVACWGFARKDL